MQYKKNIHAIQKKYWLVIAVIFLIGIQLSLHIEASVTEKIKITASKASNFIDSIGIEVRLYPDENSQLWTDTLKPRLRELGIRHIRTNISASAVSLAPGSNGRISADRIKELAEVNPPIKTTGILRESGTWQSKVKAIKYLKDSLEAIEGPNEPNRKGESFDYLDSYGVRHGYYDDSNHGDKKLVGRGWLHGVRLFMEDLYIYVKQNSNLKIVSFAPTRGAYDTVAKYQKRNNWNLEDWIDYGNFHFYQQKNPESSNILDKVKASMYPTKPIVITETGYSTNKQHWPNVPNEEIQAIYNLRSILNFFRLGVKRTYVFSLLRLEHGRYFSLLNPDDEQYPIYEPRTGFYTFKNIIALLEEENVDFTPQTLHYEMGGNFQTLPEQLLLQKSSGEFYLILWLGIPYHATQLNQIVNFKLKTPGFTKANIYKFNNISKKNMEVTTKINNPYSFHQLNISDKPLVIELIPKSL